MAEPDLELSNAELLSQLRDLRMPDPVGWWPVASGWWVLGLLVLLASAVLARRYVLTRRPANDVLMQLEALYRQWRETGDSLDYLQQVNRLLRGNAIVVAGRERVARLTGERWIQWLDSSTEQSLSATTVQALTVDCYRMDTTLSVPSIHQELSAWLTAHMHTTSVGTHA